MSECELRYRYYPTVPKMVKNYVCYWLELINSIIEINNLGMRLK